MATPALRFQESRRRRKKAHPVKTIENRLGTVFVVFTAGLFLFRDDRGMLRLNRWLPTSAEIYPKRFLSELPTGQNIEILTISRGGPVWEFVFRQKKRINLR